MQPDFPSADMSTGVTAIDELHRDFSWAMRRAARASDEEFVAEYGVFVRRAERTFGIEEHWMEEAGCPLLMEHREQHARVLGALHNVHGRILAGDIALGREVLETLLPQWFGFHVATMDMTLATLLLAGRHDVAAPKPADEPEAEAAYEG